MKIEKVGESSLRPLSRMMLLGAVAGLTFTSVSGGAQLVQAGPLLVAGAALPDSPGVVREESREAERESSSSADGAVVIDFGAPAAPTVAMAGPTDKYIAPGQVAPKLTVGNKFALGVKDAISPLAAVGWLISAGYGQALNGSPNYGTNATAFAQRFGAAAARATSEGIFSDSVMDSVLREDPRYYRMGPGHSFVKRIVYAGTRAIITRTDSGRSSPNFALLAGNLGGSYLTKAYYPPLNQSNTEVFKTFGGSIGGSALGFVVSEFLPSGFNIFHGSKPASN